MALNPKILLRLTGPDTHEWLVCSNQCDITDVDDPTVSHMVQVVRDAYGEAEILQALTVDPDVESMFDVRDVLAGFRLGLPDPLADEKKPANFRISRSETAEFFARETLRMVAAVATPPSLHACKGNAMQPMLGYDGWGIVEQPVGQKALVLIQVKGSDDDNCPPAVAHELVAECKAVAIAPERLSRAIAACFMRVQDLPIGKLLLGMLEKLGSGELPAIVVAPVIVRGHISPKIGDLDPLKLNVGQFGPISALGISVGVGAPLHDFGRLVMQRARGQ
jgi:hypothetical protein